VGYRRSLKIATSTSPLQSILVLGVARRATMPRGARKLGTNQLDLLVRKKMKRILNKRSPLPTQKLHFGPSIGINKF